MYAMAMQAMPPLIGSTEIDNSSITASRSPAGLFTMPLMRIGIVPFLQIGGRAGPLLFFFGWTLPGLIGLLGILPIGLLAWIVVRVFFAHVIYLSKQNPPGRPRFLPHGTIGVPAA
jgi:hypothetical protein